MRKLNFLLALVFMTMGNNISAQEHMTLPSADSLKTINDSIVSEAVDIYVMEKASWIATDEFDANKKDRSIVSGSVSFYVGGDTIKTVFVGDDLKKCLFSVDYCMDTGKYLTYNEAYDLDSATYARVERRYKAINLAKQSLNIQSSNLNFSYLPVSDDYARVYCLQGISDNNVIPWGNDGYCDISYDGELLKVEKCHKSYIPVNVPLNKVFASVYHSHLKDNPYITSSDIATFLLYGHDLYGMNEFYVFSTAFDCYFKFDVRTMTITVDNPVENKKSATSFSYDNIKKYVDTHRTEYDALLKRFADADTTLTDEEIKTVYYGFSYTESYSGIGSTDNIEIKKLMRDSKFDKAKRKFLTALADNPVNTGLLISGFDIYYSLKDDSMLKEISWKITKLIDTILRSGAGTEDSPMYVIDVSDEYSTMYQALGVTKMTQQSLVGSCDVMDVIINNTKTKLYFDTQRSLMRMNEIYSK